MQTFLWLECRAERRFWVDSRRLLDGSIVLSAVGTLNRSNDLSVRATRALMAEEGGVEREREGRVKERTNFCVGTSTVCLRENSGSWIGVCRTKSGKCPGREMEPIHPWQRNYRFAPLLSSVLPRHALSVHGSSRINCLWKSGLARNDSIAFCSFE